MSKKKRDLTSDEKILWRRVASTVKPRRPQPVEIEEASPPSRLPKRERGKVATDATLEVAKHGHARTYWTQAPIVDRGGEKRVRRGKLEIDGMLDLHGHTLDAARAALFYFLHNARRENARAVLVITGKGAKGEGAIKRHILDWLEARDLKPLVSGFSQAHRTHGGAGALYVFLKRA